MMIKIKDQDCKAYCNDLTIKLGALITTWTQSLPVSQQGKLR